MGSVPELESEKKQDRAKRFGTSAVGTEDEKKQQRQQRFNAGGGAVAATNASGPELEKARKRAERFGLNGKEVPAATATNGTTTAGASAASKSADEEAKRKRAERFSAGASTGTTDEADKKKQRSERFGNESEEAKKEFSQLTDKAKSASESLEQVSASIGGALTAIQENMGSPADLLPKFEELESGLNGAIDTTKGILGDLKALAVTAPKNTVTMVEEVLNKVEKFKVSAPKTISKAFSPPCCCCCCGGVSDAQTKLEEGLERVSDLLNLTPLVDGCKNAKDAIKKIDFDGVTKALDDLSEKFTSTLKPAKDFAQKAGGMVPDALRDAAGGEDAPPENE